MNLVNVRRVLVKELRDTLRDRRTILIMLVVPVFLYPALLIVLEQLALFGRRQITEAPARVVVVGGRGGAAEFLARDSALRVSLEEAIPTAELAAGQVDATVRFLPPEGPQGTERAQLLYDATRDRSRRAQSLVLERLERWNDSLLAGRLREAGLPPSFAAPLVVADSSVASAERVGGYTLGRFLPMLLILITLLGAFYPAIDLTAGEKERGTLETLLTTPVPAREIVTGKFLAVVSMALAAGALNLGSMLLTFQSGIFQMAREAGIEFRLPLTTVALLLLFLVPLAVLFSALFLGIAVRAQSFKEAQNALTPIQLASLVPTYLPLIPGIPFSYLVAVVPVGGVAVLFRELMAGEAPFGPSVVALGATVVYALLALRYAASSFGREEVLFGSGGGGAAPEPWPARLARWRTRPREFPRAAEALGFVAVVALLYFYIGVRLQLRDVESGLLASQWLLLAAPAVLFAALGPFRLRTTLALRPASPRAFLAAALIIAGGIPISWLLGWLQSRVMEIPEEFLQGMQNLLAADTPGRLLWLLLLVAVTPAICEELVFRGVLLQGLGSELSMRRAVVGTALVFGAFHLSFETVIRFLPTAWLGALLGYVVWNTRSVFTGMLMHFINNGSVLVLVASTSLQAAVTGPSGEPRWIAVLFSVPLLAAGVYLLPKRVPVTPTPGL